MKGRTFQPWPRSSAARADAAGLGNTSTGTSVTSGATLNLNGVAVGAEAVTINGSGVSSGGALSSTGVASVAGAVTLGSNAQITANGGSALTLTGGVAKAGHNLPFTGAGTTNINTTGISGTADVIVDGSTVVYNTAQSYDGPTFIRNGGTLQLGDNSVMPGSPRTALTLDDTGSGSSTFDVHTHADAIASLTGADTSSKVKLGSGGSLTIGVGSGTTTFAGVISNILAGSIIKDGASTQILSGSNTYAGATTITDGTLQLGASNV